MSVNNEDVWSLGEEILPLPVNCIGSVKLDVKSIVMVGDKNSTEIFSKYFSTQCKTRPTLKKQVWEVIDDNNSDSGCDEIKSSESSFPVIAFDVVAKFLKGPANDLTILLLPNTVSTFNDLSQPGWLSVLSEACKVSKRLIIVSTEITSNDPQLLLNARAESLYGSLICACWEFPKCVPSILRIVGEGRSAVASPASDNKAISGELLSNLITLELQQSLQQADLESIYRLSSSLSSPSSLKELNQLRSIRMNKAIDRGIPSIPPEPSATVYEKEDVALITGGTGSLGLMTARVLVNLGCGHIALVSRSGKIADDDTLLYENILKLAKEKKIIVQIFHCDISDAEKVGSLLQEMKAAFSGLPITGVIHSAGILKDGLLASGSAARGLSAVYAAKATSCAILDGLLQSNSMKFFVVFSSIAASVGNAGQANYAFSNRAIESIVYRRRTNQVNPSCGLAIRWPGITGSAMGRTIHASLHKYMATSEYAEGIMYRIMRYYPQYEQQAGHVITILPNEIVEMGKTNRLKASFAQVHSSSLRVEDTYLQYPIPPAVPKIEEVAKDLPVPVIVAVPAAVSAPAAAVVEIPVIDIQATVITLATRLIPGMPAEKLSITEGLMKQGMDSVCAAQLSVELSVAFDLDLPRTLVYQCPNIQEMVTFLQQEIYPNASAATATDSQLTEANLMKLTAKNIDEKKNSLSLVLPSPSSVATANMIMERGESMETVVYDHYPVITAPPPLAGPTASPASLSLLPSQQQHQRHHGLHLQDICITGLSLDLPGNITSLDDLWYTLSTRCIHTSTNKSLEMANHFNHGYYQHMKKEMLTDLLKPMQYGYLLSSEQKFTANTVCKTLGINEKEVESMHLTQKLLLKHAVLALQDAGYDVPMVANSSSSSSSSSIGKQAMNPNTGIFVGISGIVEDDQQVKYFSPHATDSKVVMHTTPTAPQQSDTVYGATSHTLSVAAGRISYALGFTGPCLAIDTACSSSLVALHTARRSLQLYECDVAIVLAVNILDDSTSFACSLAHMLAEDGICRVFDSDAKGYARGEGCGAIVLKREEDCLALHQQQQAAAAEEQQEQQQVYCKIKGSAIRQDGASTSLTAPNVNTQVSVMTQALKDSGLTIADIDILEAHGTGTVYGDPVEIAAISQVYRDRCQVQQNKQQQSQMQCQPLHIMASKACVGHSEAMAGLTGIFASILAMQHQKVPSIASLETINPIISQQLQKLPADTINICRQGVILPEVVAASSASSTLLHAAVSSFGYSGTIAHVILEEASSASHHHGRRVDRRNQASAEDDQQALKEYITSKYFDHYRPHSSPAMAVAIPAQQPKMAMIKINHNVVWQFTGQGSLQMYAAKILYEKNTTYRHYLTICDQIMMQYYKQQHSQQLQQQKMVVTASSLLYPAQGNTAAIQQAEKLLQETRYSQVVLVALEISLALTLIDESSQCLPEMMLGHSLGEYAAMVAIGHWTIEQAMELVIGRAQAISQAKGCLGSMYAVRMTKDQALLELAAYNSNSNSKFKADKISIAAVNGEQSLVLSGDEGQLSSLLQAWKNDGKISSFIKLPVNHGFHSPLMKHAEKDFGEVLDRILRKTHSNLPAANQQQQQKTKFYSTLRGKEMTREELSDRQYWIDHMVQSVLYYDTVHAIAANKQQQQSQLQQSQQQPPMVFIEIGPQPILTKLAQTIFGKLNNNSHNSNNNKISTPTASASQPKQQQQWQSVFCLGG